MKKLPLQQGIVYGPVNSRRLGRSLGINLLPTTFKLCSLNCSYCQYGWTKELTTKAGNHIKGLPSARDIEKTVREVFSLQCDFDYITFSGNGEPTLHPEFPDIVEMVDSMKQKLRPEVKLAILSNSTTCGDPKTKEVLAKIDLPIMKLDVGNERAFKKMNHGVLPVTLEDIVAGLKDLDRYVIQSMFVKGAVDNSTDAEVKSWIKRLQELQPLWVQIYSLDRGTASKQLKRVEPRRLKEIAMQAKEITGLSIEAY